MPHLKRWIFLTHRWLGVALCVLFALWFVSGVVMMYVGYPKLTPAERLMHLPPLRGAAVALQPEQALAAAGLQDPLRELRLAVASGGRAVYLATPQPPPAAQHGGARHRRAPVVVDANTGALLTAVDAPLALASAAAYAPGTAHPVHEGTLQEDAFTHSRALDMHRPLHRVRLGDAQDTVLYVSGATGEVVRDATRAERLWNYAGAWLHWLYPLRGGLVDGYWADIVNALSLLGIAAVLTGGVVGIIRWRFAGTYRSGRRTPFASAWARWHHVAGLLFMAVTLAWIFSGLMSMNPWRIFDSGAPALRAEAMHGGPLQAPRAGASVAALLQAAPADTRELRWSRTAGHTLVQALPASGPPAVLDAVSALPHAWRPGELQAAASRLVDAPLLRTDTLRAYDAYYYAREPHTMTGGGDKPLPVLRLVFGDAHASWVHVDPHTGAVLGRLDRHRRASRWLFGLLHSWDWLPLLQRRPLWDALLVTLSAGGTLLSLSGIVLGWRRVRRKLGWRAAAAHPAPGRR